MVQCGHNWRNFRYHIDKNHVGRYLAIFDGLFCILNLLWPCYGIGHLFVVVNGQIFDPNRIKNKEIIFLPLSVTKETRVPGPGEEPEGKSCKMGLINLTSFVGEKSKQKISVDDIFLAKNKDKKESSAGVGKPVESKLLQNTLRPKSAKAKSETSRPASAVKPSAARPASAVRPTSTSRPPSGTHTIKYSAVTDSATNSG